MVQTPRSHSPSAITIVSPENTTIAAPNGPPAAPTAQRRATKVRSAAPSSRDGNKKVEPTSGFEPLTCSLRVS